MVIVTIDSDFLSGKLCMEKAIRSITINNEGSIVDTTDMSGNKVKKLELLVILPDAKEMKWRPNKTAKKSFITLFGTDTTLWNGKKVKLVLTPFQDTYSIGVDELETPELNKGKGKGGTLL